MTPRELYLITRRIPELVAADNTDATQELGQIATRLAEHLKEAHERDEKAKVVAAQLEHVREQIEQMRVKEGTLDDLLLAAVKNALADYRKR